VLRKAESASIEVILSCLVELELLVKPLCQKNRALVNGITIFLEQFPNLRTVPVSRGIARRAAEIRAESRLSLPDAVIVATCLDQGCGVVVGNDKRCAERIREVKYIYLDDFVGVKGQ